MTHIMPALLINPYRCTPRLVGDNYLKYPLKVVQQLLTLAPRNTQTRRDQFADIPDGFYKFLAYFCGKREQPPGSTGRTPDIIARSGYAR
jgi:hypothetical protein